MDHDNQNVRVHAKVSGRVQGVNYRWYTREEATRLGLRGWVCNQSDGSVELVAEGNRENVDALIEWCGKGPPLAAVADLNTHWEEATCEFDQFDIRY